MSKSTDANAFRATYGVDALRNNFDHGLELREPRIDAAAKGELRDEPLPLFPQRPPAALYPVRALGRVLGSAAGAISRKVQVPLAIAAQSVLGVASVATQCHADVILPYGQGRPVSLFLFTIAAFGDRKTTSDNEAMWPIRQRERKLQELHSQESKSYAIAVAAWEAEHRKVTGNRKLDHGSRKLALEALGCRPEPPLHPFLTTEDPTIEGLVKNWTHAPAGQGIFSAEGGTFTGGYGMSAENKLRTAAGYSRLWEGHTAPRVRAGDGALALGGRRLSMHVMVQPEAATQFLSDPVLRDQGLLSRILIVAPESLAGTRLYSEPHPDDEAAIREYGEHMLSILESPWPLAGDRVQGVIPRLIKLSDDATRRWKEFHDDVERQSGSGGRYNAVWDLAGKIAEHAARIAGVLSLVKDLSIQEVDESTMSDAVMLARWYLDEAYRLRQSIPSADPSLVRAAALLAWLQGRGSEVHFSEILQFGPAQTRTKKEADAAIGTLTAHNWVEEISNRPRIIRLQKRAVTHA